MQTLNLNQDGSRSSLSMVYQEYMNTPFRLEYDIAINLIMINFLSHYRSRCPNCQLQIPASKFEMAPGKYKQIWMEPKLWPHSYLLRYLLILKIFSVTNLINIINNYNCTSWAFMQFMCKNDLLCLNIYKNPRYFHKY